MGTRLLLRVTHGGSLLGWMGQFSKFPIFQQAGGKWSLLPSLHHPLVSHRSVYIVCIEKERLPGG